MDDDHDLVADIDSDTLIRIVKFLKRGKAPGPDNIHNEVLRLGTTTSLFHHLARLFTSSILSPGVKLKTFSNQRVRAIIRHCISMRKPPRLTQVVERHFGIQSDNFDLKHFDEVNQFIEDNYVYFYPPEDPDDYRADMDDDHDLVADIDSDTLIRIVKFLKRCKAPGPDNIHNEVLRLGTTTSLFHHLARLFTSSIQIGYIPTTWKLATLRMLLKPDKLPSITASYRPISLTSSIMKLFEWVIEQRLCCYLEDIGFINKYQSGFRQAKSTDDHLFRLSQSVMESFNRREHVVAAFLAHNAQ